MATQNLDGVSTLGVHLGKANWTSAVDTVAKASALTFTEVGRVDNIGGISIDPETIDISAMNDTVQKTTQGRASTGGTVAVSVLVAPQTMEEWQAMAGQKVVFEVYHEATEMDKAWYFVGEVPAQIPMPESAQNEAWKMEINLTLYNYLGIGSKKAVGGNSAS